ncbi:MAG: hypothetical protein ABSD70_19885, partial [Terracidiphilus sp.]
AAALLEFARSFDQLGRPKPIPAFRWDRSQGAEPARHRTWRRLAQSCYRFRLFRRAGLADDTPAERKAFRELQKQERVALMEWVG